MRSSDKILKMEEKMIINYVYYVLNFKWENDSDSTMELLMTKSYGLLTPNRVLELIELGAITVVNYNKNVA